MSVIAYFKYLFITKDLKITLFQVFTAWYTYKMQRLKCSLYWSCSQSESKNCVYVKTVLGTAAISHCKSDLSDFSVCMAVYGLQQFSSTDTMVLAQSGYSSLPKETPYKCICTVSSFTCLWITVPVRL